jgi:hypothetical protein
VQIRPTPAPASVTHGCWAVGQSGNAVLLSAAEFAALEETAYLLRVPADGRMVS